MSLQTGAWTSRELTTDARTPVALVDLTRIMEETRCDLYDVVVLLLFTPPEEVRRVGEGPDSQWFPSYTPDTRREA